ncbi:integrase, catalytic region, zinc finger, CCHC-type containing protein [Tanacetum coccineum]
MTGDRSGLRNFVNKFIGTVRFGNDHFGAIMGYRDYVIGYSVISRVYYVEGLGHSAFRKHTCFARDLDGVDLIKGSRDYYESVGITHKKTVLRTPQQNGIVERRNRTLVEATRTMLIFSKAPLFLWAEAVATAYLELLFQPMFDEYFETPTGDHPMPPIPTAPTPAILTGPSISISFDHDAPSGSHSPSSLVHHGVTTEHSFEVNPFAAIEHEPFVNVFAPDPNSEASSFG